MPLLRGLPSEEEKEPSLRSPAGLGPNPAFPLGSRVAQARCSSPLREQHAQRSCQAVGRPTENGPTKHRVCRRTRRATTFVTAPVTSHLSGQMFQEPPDCVTAGPDVGLWNSCCAQAASHAQLSPHSPPQGARIHLPAILRGEARAGKGFRPPGPAPATAASACPPHRSPEWAAGTQPPSRAPSLGWAGAILPSGSGPTSNKPFPNHRSLGWLLYLSSRVLNSFHKI